MRNLWWDGFFAESSEVIWLQYFPVYALALGASTGLIGVLAAIGSLLAAFSMWPGAFFAEKTRRYKVIVLLTAGGLGRLVFFLLVALPWAATGNAVLVVLVAVAALRGFFGSVAMPAWGAFAARFVPVRLRGRYFASRNFARQVAGLGTAPLIGLMITGLGGTRGWQVAWLAALVLGMTATAFYLRIPTNAATPREGEPEPAPAPQTTSALRDRRLVWFVATSSFFQFAVMLAGPFFSVYLVQNLGGSALWVGIAAAAAPLAGIVAQPVVGKLNDRLGPKWLLVTSGLVLPAAPLLWTVVTAPWHVVFINLLAGALWAANLLASFNLVLAIAPEEKRPTYSGLHQAGVFFASFLGPILGGFLIPAVGFKAVFILSGAGRWMATALLWRFVTEEEAEGVLPRNAGAQQKERKAQATA